MIYLSIVKDARSVSLYPYNRSKSCNMFSILNKVTLQKKLQNVLTNNKNYVFGQKSKNTQQ